jgi:cytochrome P450
MIDRSIDNAIASGKTYGNLETQHALYTLLRAEDPVHWTEPEGFRPFWTVSRHADLVEVERQPERFLNEPRSRLLSIEFEQRVKTLMEGRRHLVQSMHMMDGDKHKAYRQITAAWFQPRQLKSLDERITALARRAIDDMAGRGPEIDFCTDVTAWYPLRVIMLMLGLPEQDAPRLLNITRAYFGGSDPEMQQGSDQIAAAQAFRDYFDVVAADRKVHPKEDVASLIAHATVDGQPIGHYESSSYYIALAGAGHDTTAASMAGGVLAFIEHPQEWRRLQDNPALIGSAIDEMIRWVSPIKHFFRTAVADSEFRGRHIRAGDNLLMAYPSANRDEEAFQDPFAFRIDRSPNRHVGFGYGVHACLGMMLAKLEMQIFLRELLARVERFELAGRPSWVETSFVGGLKHLPVRLTMK